MAAASSARFGFPTGHPPESQQNSVTKRPSQPYRYLTPLPPPTETDGGGTGAETDEVAAEAVRLDQELDLYVDNEYLNWGGLNEKWLQSRSQNGAWYYITPDGGFYQWLGDVASNATQIATLNASYYDDLSRLYNAAE